jgi:hypothetical protein
MPTGSFAALTTPAPSSPSQIGTINDRTRMIRGTDLSSYQHRQQQRRTRRQQRPATNATGPSKLPPQIGSGISAPVPTACEDTETIIDRLDTHTKGGITTILDRIDELEAKITTTRP